MGNNTGARRAYEAVVERAARAPSATHIAEKQVMETQELNPLVDPGANNWGKSRRSLIRFNNLADGRFEVAVGLSVPVEIRLDTTGSMGHNVDVALKGIPDTRDYLDSVMRPGCEAHVATGVFNDVVDRFSNGKPGVVMTRSQFEMTEKMAEQMQYHIPMRQGGDGPEDPHYGLFGAAYLTSFYINRIGLKGYDFTISDATAHSALQSSQLERIYGKDVYDAVAENGHQFSPKNLPSNRQVVKDLLTRSHAFFLQVGNNPETTRFWTDLMGENRIVVLPRTELLPQVVSAIVGLTEGTLDLQSVREYLETRGVSKRDAELIERSVRNIPIGAQTVLENFNNIPVRGDIFNTKEDLWPAVRAADRSDFDGAAKAPEEVGNWL
jgi:hypothetical protein